MIEGIGLLVGGVYLLLILVPIAAVAYWVIRLAIRHELAAIKRREHAGHADDREAGGEGPGPAATG